LGPFEEAPHDTAQSSNGDRCIILDANTAVLGRTKLQVGSVLLRSRKSHPNGKHDFTEGREPLTFRCPTPSDADIGPPRGDFRFGSVEQPSWGASRGRDNEEVGEQDVPPGVIRFQRAFRRVGNRHLSLSQRLEAMVGATVPKSSGTARPTPGCAHAT